MLALRSRGSLEPQREVALKEPHPPQHPARRPWAGAHSSGPGGTRPGPSHLAGGEGGSTRAHQGGVRRVAAALGPDHSQGLQDRGCSIGRNPHAVLTHFCGERDGHTRVISRTAQCPSWPRLRPPQLAGVVPTQNPMASGPRGIRTVTSAPVPAPGPSAPEGRVPSRPSQLKNL